ncbi:hypothetical protein PMAC_000632 [Pneumocystis sp. 'macacae']|nr:hypothetical protein PMAC_000632 [Pneumocystis sp. 'macacae']
MLPAYAFSVQRYVCWRDCLGVSPVPAESAECIEYGAVRKPCCSAPFCLEGPVVCRVSAADRTESLHRRILLAGYPHDAQVDFCMWYARRPQRLH